MKKPHRATGNPKGRPKGSKNKKTKLKVVRPNKFRENHSLLKAMNIVKCYEKNVELMNNHYDGAFNTPTNTTGMRGGRNKNYILYQKYETKVKKASAMYSASKRLIVTIKGDILKGEEWDRFVKSEMKEMREIRTKETGVKWEIDHIIPIKGKNICGLNVWYNLQLITKSDNYKKRNKVYQDRGIYND
ncbi:hypothetical protein ACXDGR_000153 [Klebsiella pneumoniae]